MLTGQSKFSSVTSCFWPVKIFTKKSSTRKVSLIKPTNIICLFQSMLDHLKIGLIFFWTDLTPVVQMAFLSILNAWQTASKWSLAVWTDMRWCMFSWEVIIKKRLKRSDLRLGISLFIQEWTMWPSQYDMTGQHDRRVKFLASQVTILARHCLLTGHYFEPWIFINQSDLTSTSVTAVWQKLCISDWKALNVRGCRRTKLKICGSKYSMFTIFYTIIFMHNKSNSYQTMFKW